MKVVIYIRTSTTEQNPELQLRDCKSINQYGKPEIISEQQSAYKDKDRPKFETVKKQIKQGKIDHLIVWDLDRIYRNRKKLIEFFQFCKIYSCKIHSFRQQWLENLNQIQAPFNEIMYDLMLQIMGWLAEEESKKKSDRARIAYQGRSKKWGRKPISRTIENKVMNLHAEGKTLREIALEVVYWDKSRNKHQLSKSAVHKIIQKRQQRKS